MMIWLWLCGCVALLFVLVVVSDVKVNVYFSRVAENDKLFFEIRAFYGLVRRRIHIPMIKFRGLLQGFFVQSRQFGGVNSELRDQEHMHLTPEEIIRFYRNSRILLDKTDDLLGWMKATVAHVKCTELRWETRIGIGDAAETAVTTGIVWGLKSSLLGLLSRMIRVEAVPRYNVQPQYNRVQFTTEFAGRGQVRLGYVMWAGLLLLLRIVKVKGGIRAWQHVLFKTA